MIAATGNGILNFRFYVGIVSAILFLSTAQAVSAAEETTTTGTVDDQIRVSRSLRIPQKDKEKIAELDKQSHRYEALEKSGTRSAPSQTQNLQTQNLDHDFWFYTADVILLNDFDGDGYYTTIDLMFDVDTYYDVADVYAVAYLSYEGGPWNEYAVTDTFPIFGATGDDAQVIVTDLLSGYPTGYYDLLIEIFDAFDGSFLASYGPDDTSELFLLGLEDADRDVAHGGGVVVVDHDHGGGGATGWLTIFAMLLLVLGTALRNYRERRQEAPVRQRHLD